MMVVGITGPTGAGKSIVCRLLGEWERISVIDCDQVSRQVQQAPLPPAHHLADRKSVV